MGFRSCSRIGVAIGLLLIAELAMSRAQGSTDELQCPSDPNSGTELERFRNDAVKVLGAGKEHLVGERLSSCFSGGAPPCLKALADEVKPVVQQRSADQLTLKSESDLPPEFLVRNANGEVKPGLVKFPDNLIELSKEKGWKTIAYKTRSTGGFDQAPNLTLVAIPGEQKDIYLQISPPPDNTGSHTPDFKTNPSKGQRVLTVITVDKTKSPPQGQLRLLGLDQAAGGYRWSNQTVGGRDCFSCHSTPLRTISPVGYLHTNGQEVRMKPEQEQVVTEINNMMLVKDLSWEPGMGPDASFQPYGWAPPDSQTRTDDFIKGCAQRAKPVTYQAFSSYKYAAQPSGNMQNIDIGKLKNAMSCTRCHNGSVRGPLHAGFSFDEIKFKVLVDQSMPPVEGGHDSKLNTDERLALLNCLKEEFAANRNAWSERKEWLSQVSCTTFSSTESSSRRRRRSN